MSENMKLLGLFKTGTSLTVGEAKKFGFSENLRSRVSSLELMGYDFNKSDVYEINSNQVLVRVKRYSLAISN